MPIPMKNSRQYDEYMERTARAATEGARQSRENAPSAEQQREWDQQAAAAMENASMTRRSPVADPVSNEPTVRCDCGHTVPRSQVMAASMGRSCPDCFDRMSD